MNLIAALFALCLTVACSIPAHAQSAKKEPATPSPLTYDPFATSKYVAQEWAKVKSSFPEDQQDVEMMRRVLARLPGERDESYAYRAYYFFGSESNLSKALNTYRQLESNGHGSTHRWLVVTDASGDRLYFVDMRTATVGEVPSIWIHERRRGVLLTANKWEINCARRETRSMAFTKYRADGAPQESDSTPLHWEAAIPGSVAEGLLEFSCS